jgi:hypothetical protein
MLQMINFSHSNHSVFTAKLIFEYILKMKISCNCSVYYFVFISCCFLSENVRNDKRSALVWI